MLINVSQLYLYSQKNIHFIFKNISFQRKPTIYFPQNVYLKLITDLLRKKLSSLYADI